MLTLCKIYATCVDQDGKVSNIMWRWWDEPTILQMRSLGYTVVKTQKTKGGNPQPLLFEEERRP